MNVIILKSLSVVREILREKLGTTNAHELYELCNWGLEAVLVSVLNEGVFN